MTGLGVETTAFEVAIVVPKRREKGRDESCDCVEFLVRELKRAGLVVERVCGISDEFIKLAAPMATLGRAAAELHMKKLTYIGMELQFEWDQATAFVMQPDGSLFSWCERFRCFHHVIYGIAACYERSDRNLLKTEGDCGLLQDRKVASNDHGENTGPKLGWQDVVKLIPITILWHQWDAINKELAKKDSYVSVNNTEVELTLSFDGKEFQFRRNESLLKRFEAEGIVKQVFPLHDEAKRKQLLRTWALNLLHFTWQPIDEIYSYFGTKIGTYFAFIGMYTLWLFFPAAFGLTLQLVDFGSLQLLVLPAFFIFIISWAVFFFQFWKRKNAALLARWGINYSLSQYKAMDAEMDSFTQNFPDHGKKFDTDKPTEKKLLQRDEWLGLLIKIRNNAIIVLAIICLQLPFELAYAHLYEINESDILKYVLTAVYILAIQYFTRIGGKVSVILIKYENNQGEESSAASLVYKVFGLYFMQTYIGLFYHALLHRNFASLRQVLIQRLIVSQVLENLIENSIPYLKYSYKKYKAVHKKKHEKGSPVGKVIHFAARVEKEYLKPSYTASIGAELEDGLFDDFLELALQFGMIMMFACAFPFLFCLATLHSGSYVRNNITEIRTDALKLLVMLRRPVPRAAATIGAWLNIFQFLIVMAICTNCALLVCLYDQEGKWRVEPGLAAILLMEHVLLVVKFAISHFVPEEPAWVKANRVRDVDQARNMCNKQLLRSISSIERVRKTD